MTGPRDISDDQAAALKRSEGRAFRPYDDDGVRYNSGRILGGDGFEPLDDFGTPNAGATEIRYYYEGKWRAL